ncbi:MAG: DUF58 domain-containing protein [Microthrixaceae bacterium]
MRLTRAGVAVLAAAIAMYWAGAALDWIELVILATACLVAVVAGVAAVYRRSGIQADRFIRPDRVTRGQPAIAYLVLDNQGRRTSPPAVAHERFRGGTQVIVLPRVAPRATATTTYYLTTDRRGIYPVGPLRFVRVDALGLVRLARRVADEVDLCVYPKVEHVVMLPSSLARNLEGPTSDTAAEGTITFHRLREYVIGDDLRMIHWRSSARTGKLMVRHNIDTSRPSTTIVLDTRPEVYESEEAFEVAVEIVASLVVASARMNFPVRLRTTDGVDLTRRLDPTAREFLEFLAVVEQRSGGSLVEAVGTLRTNRSGESLIVTTGSPPAEEVIFVGSIRRRFERATVALTETPGPGSPRPRGVRVFASSSCRQFAKSWNAPSRR